MQLICSTYQNTAQDCRKNQFFLDGSRVICKKAFEHSAGCKSEACFILADQSDDSVKQIVGTCITNDPLDLFLFIFKVIL